MAWGFKRMKTEHSGAKNGGGFWGTRREAKEASKRRRRRNDKKEINSAHSISGEIARLSILYRWVRSPYVL